MRYDARRGTLKVIVGDPANVPREVLVQRAAEAMRAHSFICHTTDDEDALLGADEICFIPRSDCCEIVSIHTNGWRHHHGDHRRSLVEILNDLAAAVARGTLSFLDDQELAVVEGSEIFACTVDDPASLTQARSAVAQVLDSLDVDSDARRRLELCVSEATTNMLVHGGGEGTMRLLLVGDRLRAVVADRGPGLNFLNWTEEAGGANQPSMGYGYKIILDNLERVYLHTGDEGTTLVLDRTI
jgi:anti-sigma regulatory factor (Ser/Thr protein kinase)/1,2-phenylacetyl-CoA epoxidase PaaB subunit